MLKCKFILTEVLDSFFAIPENDRSIVIKLNEVGKDILELLQENRQESEIITLLAEEYSTAESNIKRDLNSLIDELKKYNLFE